MTPMRDYVPPPPPPPRSSGGGCWKWGGITCGVGCVLAIVAIVIIIAAAPKNLKSFVGQTFQMGADSAQAQKDMKRVYAAIQKYHQDKGKYPDKLDELVPTYVPSQAELKLATHPDGPEFTYYKPKPGSDPTDMMLEYKFTITGPDGKRVSIPVGLEQNGEWTQGAAKVERPGARRGASPGGATSGGESAGGQPQTETAPTGR